MKTKNYFPKNLFVSIFTVLALALVASSSSAEDNDPSPEDDILVNTQPRGGPFSSPLDKLIYNENDPLIQFIDWLSRKSSEVLTPHYRNNPHASGAWSSEINNWVSSDRSENCANDFPKLFGKEYLISFIGVFDGSEKTNETLLNLEKIRTKERRVALQKCLATEATTSFSNYSYRFAKRELGRIPRSSDDASFARGLNRSISEATPQEYLNRHREKLQSLASYLTTYSGNPDPTDKLEKVSETTKTSDPLATPYIPKGQYRRVETRSKPGVY